VNNFKEHTKVIIGHWQYLWVLILSLVVFSCVGQSRGKGGDKILGFDSLLKLKGSVVSGYVINTNTKEIIAAVNQEYRMTPASLSKIFTSSAALNLLGPNYKFTTGISISSDNISDGILKGDVIITGGGDPTLGSKYFAGTHPDSIFLKILLSLKKSGIKTVSGDLILVSDYFSKPAYPSLRLWEDMSNYYGAPPSGLSFMDNTFTVSLESPSKPGILCKVTEITPDCGITFDCRVIASLSQKDSAYIYGAPGLKEWYIDGSIPTGREEFKIKGALPYPEKVFGRLLKSFLNKNGISVDRLSFKSSKEIKRSIDIGKIDSPPLSSIVKVLNKRSINLFADHLFLAMARERGRANWDNARKVVSEFWSSSIGTNEIYLHDGSGLSPFNYCSPVDMTDALIFMSDSELSGLFKESLSISGVDGTLKRMWNTPETKGRVKGKSGYMKGVLGYAGYIKTKKNRKLTFCIIVNRFTEPVSEVRRLIEMEVEKIILEN